MRVRDGLAGGVATLALGALLMAPPALAESAGYTLSRQYGSVLFRVLFQDTLYLVGRFDEFDGKLQLDPADPASARLEATVNMGSLDMRDGDVAETLVNSSVWFNTPLYPQARFVSQSTELLEGNRVRLDGELEFVGVSQPWSLEAEFFGGSDGELSGRTVGMQASGSFKRSDFGVDQYMNMAADEVAIEINVQFNRD